MFLAQSESPQLQSVSPQNMLHKYSLHKITAHKLDSLMSNDTYIGVNKVKSLMWQNSVIAVQYTDVHGTKKDASKIISTMTAM